ncbi:MAG: hypothetical protein CMF69_11070 [Magnetovibrio sp.]|nr:hypothetical protein [Magnetovibrio sp.]|tara:strand:+ start:753 stop:2036 length:1284 start_codon:yes stop_codon:yes gene_type:complete
MEWMAFHYLLGKKKPNIMEADKNNLKAIYNPWLCCLPALVFSHAVGTLNVVSVLAMAPVIRGEFELSAALFGTFVSAYYGAQAIGSLPAGSITDRYGITFALIISHFTMVIGALIVALAPDYKASVLGMVFMGFGYSLTNPSTARGVLAWFPKEHRGLAMGLKQVGVPLGGLLAALNGALAADINWQLLMYGVAIIIAINGIFCINLFRYERFVEKKQSLSLLATIGEVVRDTNFNIYAMLSGLLNIGQTNFFGFLTLFLTDVLRASQPMAAFAMGLAQTVSAIARIGWGTLSDKAFKGRRKVLKAWICGVAAVFLASMGSVGHIFDGAGLGLGLLLTVGLGITIASFAPVAQAISVEAVDPRLTGSAVGYNMLGVHIGGFVGPIIFGAAMDFFGGDYAAGWLVTAFATALGVVLLVFTFREGRLTL